MPNHGHGYIPPAFASLEIVATDNADGTGSASIQLKDAAGDNLAQRGLVRFWTSGQGGADMGAPVAIASTLSIASGTEIEEVIAKGDRIVLTSTGGAITIDVIDDAQDGTLWIMASYLGKVVSDSVTITGT